MRHAMTTIITTTCLVGTLAVATAAPRKAPMQAQPATELTSTEQHCDNLGYIASVIALRRDRGVGLLEAIHHSRQLARTLDQRLGPNAVVQAEQEITIRLIYDYPDLSPARIRQSIERVCLDRYVPRSTAAPDARLRY